MFDLRDDIAHEMKDAKLSKTRLLSLADNTMNFLDAASWMCHEKFFHLEDNNRIIRQQMPLLPEPQKIQFGSLDSAYDMYDKGYAVAIDDYL